MLESFCLKELRQILGLSHASGPPTDGHMFILYYIGHVCKCFETFRHCQIPHEMECICFWDIRMATYIYITYNYCLLPCPDALSVQVLSFEKGSDVSSLLSSMSSLQRSFPLDLYGFPLCLYFNQSDNFSTFAVAARGRKHVFLAGSKTQCKVQVCFRLCHPKTHNFTMSNPHGNVVFKCICSCHFTRIVFKAKLR